ncbi:hypothetical protein SETIT_4G197800v2, partial [Setaria italica]
SFSLLSWNVRGLGDPQKCTVVKDSISSSHPSIVCLQESKLRALDGLKARSFLPPAITAFRCVDALDTRGGIITAWDPTIFAADSFITRRHTLTVFLSSTASNYSFAVTNIYAPADHRDSLPFLEDLR